MTTPHDPDGKWPPSYPPKTPPPPKRPVEPPRPETGADLPDPSRAVMTQTRLRARIANRRAANWSLDAAPWARSSAGPKAARLVCAKLTAWGYQAPEGHKADALTTRLVAAALEDGGTRISVHLADQEQQALILVLSHHTGPSTVDDALLTDLAAVGVASCGVDTDRDGGGCRRWALIDL